MTKWLHNFNVQPLQSTFHLNYIKYDQQQQDCFSDWNFARVIYNGLGGIPADSK